MKHIISAGLGSGFFWGTEKLTLSFSFDKTGKRSMATAGFGASLNPNIKKR